MVNGKELDLRFPMISYTIISTEEVLIGHLHILHDLADSTDNGLVRPHTRVTVLWLFNFNGANDVKQKKINK